LLARLNLLLKADATLKAQAHVCGDLAVGLG
jgi:hypothetical protein